MFESEIEIPASWRLIGTLDLESNLSWSEIELYAAIHGIELDRQFIYDFMHVARIFDFAFYAFIDGFHNGSLFDCFFKNDMNCSLIHTAVEIFSGFKHMDVNDDHYKCYLDLLCRSRKSEYSATTALGKNKPYMFISSLFQRSPSAVIRYYDRYRRIIHSTNILMAQHIRKLVQKLSDEKYNRVKTIFEQTYSHELEFQKFLR